MADLKPREVKVIRAASGIDDRNILRVAAYCRVSTDSEDQVSSFIAQVKYYNDFIRLSDGMELVDIYADEGITGTSIQKREEFKRMLKDSRLGKIDRIYVKSVTRFARNALECIESIRTLKANGTSVFFENDGIDTDTMNSEIMLYIKSAFAQSEALSNSKRVSTAFRMRMENGTFVTTCAPFGYKLQDKKLVIVPEEAEIVRRIYDMYLSGIGISKLIVELNKNESKFAPWKKGRVEYILKNEKYIGDSLWQKKFTPSVLPFKKRLNKGETDMFYVEKTHEAIIDKETFQKVRILFAKKAEKLSGRSSPVVRPYSKMLFCGDCGGVYKLKDANNTHRWVCCRSGLAGRHCNTASVTEPEIEKTFVSMYNRLKQNEEPVIQKALAQITSLKKRITAGCDCIGEIDNEIASLSYENSMYIRFYQNGIADEATFREQVETLNKRITELRIRRQKLLHEDEDESCIELLRETKSLLSQMPDALLRFDSNIFRSLVKKVCVISKTALEFEFKCGLKFKENIVWN